MVIFRLFKMAAAAILDFQNLKFLRVKPRLVEKFRKFLFADVGKSELGKIKKKHAQNIRSTVLRTGDLNYATVMEYKTRKPK